MKKWLWWAVPVALFGVAAVAQKVDQGRPGNQGPWPVACVSGCSGGSGGGGDAGTNVNIIENQRCQVTAQTVVGATGTSAAVPTSSLSNRAYVQICNSVQNSDTAQAKCLTTGVPVFAAGNAGDVLATGDCVTYNVSDAITVRCIANGSGVNLTTFECVP